MVKIKRVYDNYSKDDGYRVLVDRLWPRGIAKENAHIDLWLKEIAPSNELREWFGHEEEKWDEFQKRYQEELKNNSETFEQLKKILREHSDVTLLYGAKDIEHNNAVVLQKLL